MVESVVVPVPVVPEVPLVPDVPVPEVPGVAVVPLVPLVSPVVPVPVVPVVPEVPDVPVPVPDVAGGVVEGVVAVSPGVAGLTLVVSLRLQAPSMAVSSAAVRRIFGAFESAFIDYSSFTSVECRPNPH